MTKYFIGAIICVVLIVLETIFVVFKGNKINEVSGRKTDRLYVSFIIFLLIFGAVLFYCIFKLF